jgi:[acyl-carrier-protein] S-malonyltransferase
LLVEADAGTLTETRNAQLAAFTLGLVILDAARRATPGDVPVTAYAGHSLGEYTALVAAGALDATHGSRLVRERGEAMREAASREPGTMIAVLGLDLDQVAEACASVDGAWVANDNAPGQVVVAGTLPGVAAAGRAAEQIGAKRVLSLPVGGAFHSPLMRPAVPRLEAALSEAPLRPSGTAVVTNVDAAPHRDGWARLLSEQVVAPVRWRDSLVAMAGLGVTNFVELGPGTELSGMTKRTVAGAQRASVATPGDLDGLRRFCEQAVGVS